MKYFNPKYLIPFIVILVFVVFGFIYFKPFENEGTNSGLTSIKDEKYGVSFQYPSKWHRDEIEGFSFPLFLKVNKGDEFHLIQIHVVENSTISREKEIDSTIRTAVDGTLTEKLLKVGGNDAVQVIGDFKENMPVSGSFTNTIIQNKDDVVKVLLNDNNYFDSYNKILISFVFNQ